MADITPGAQVKIRSRVDAGAFPGESLVTFSTKEGPISGFVRPDFLVRGDRGQSYVIGDVREILGDTIIVMVHGSFFTTTGLVRLSRSDVEGGAEQPNGSFADRHSTRG